MKQTLNDESIKGLVAYRMSAQTHSGTKQIPGLHFVVNGKLSPKTSSIYATLFEKRHSSDYDDFAYHDIEKLEKLYPQANEFIEISKNY